MHDEAVVLQGCDQEGLRLLLQLPGLQIKLFFLSSKARMLRPYRCFILNAISLSGNSFLWEPAHHRKPLEEVPKCSQQGGWRGGGNVELIQCSHLVKVPLSRERRLAGCLLSHAEHTDSQERSSHLGERWLETEIPETLGILNTNSSHTLRTPRAGLGALYHI